MRKGDLPKSVVISGQGQVDRSPCGTGMCAKMAFLHAHGRLRVGDEYWYQGILGTEFKGEERCRDPGEGGRYTGSDRSCVHNRI